MATQAALGTNPGSPTIRETAAGVAAVRSLAPDRPPAGMWLTAWRRFMRHRLALVGLTILITLAVASTLAPWLTPYQPNKTNLTAMINAPTLSHPLGTDELG